MTHAADVAGRMRAWLPLPAPIDVDALMDDIGARHLETALGYDVWGFTFQTERSIWVVTKQALAPADRRYTVLHEVGHVLMHAGNCLFLARHDACWASRLERAADVFAACYGIPDELVSPGVTAHELAAECGLPLEAARLRLELWV